MRCIHQFTRLSSVSIAACSSGVIARAARTPSVTFPFRTAESEIEARDFLLTMTKSRGESQLKPSSARSRSDCATDRLVRPLFAYSSARSSTLDIAFRRLREVPGLVDLLPQFVAFNPQLLKTRGLRAILFALSGGQFMKDRALIPAWRRTNTRRPRQLTWQSRVVSWIFFRGKVAGRLLLKPIKNCLRDRLRQILGLWPAFGYQLQWRWRGRYREVIWRIRRVRVGSFCTGQERFQYHRD